MECSYRITIRIIFIRVHRLPQTQPRTIPPTMRNYPPSYLPSRLYPSWKKLIRKMRPCMRRQPLPPCLHRQRLGHCAHFAIRAVIYRVAVVVVRHIIAIVNVKWRIGKCTVLFAIRDHRNRPICPNMDKRWHPHRHGHHNINHRIIKKIIININQLHRDVNHRMVV